MATILKMRFPLLLLLGIVFLALVCVSSGIAQHEQGKPCHTKCLQRCNRVNEASRRHECRSRCEGWPERCEEEEEEEEEEEGRSRHMEPGRRERGRQEGEKEEERREKRQPRRGREQQEEEEEERENLPGNRRPRREREEEEEERRPRREREEGEEEEWRGSRRREDPDERERLRQRRERRRGEEERESQRGERRRRRHEREEEEGSSSSSSSSSSESRGRRNPFFFKSNRFQTLFENENGRIRLLQRFDKRSNRLQNLQNYRLLEYRSKPHTLFLPQHTDADFILVVLSGRAILTVVNPDDRNSFNLERGDAIKLPAGTIAYLANRDDDKDLRVVDLAVPVNRPGQFQSFFTSSSQNQQSYFRGFSKDILEASLNTKYEEIERVLLEEQQERQQQRRGRKERQQSQEANDPIVKVSKEQIEELSKNAKSSSKKSTSSESEPFNLRSRNPIYSNKFGKFFEITPEKNPQLQDLNLLLNSVEIREGALLLPHYNSRAFVIGVVNEGKGHLELVAQRNEQQQQQEQGEQEEEEEEEQQEEEERSRQVQRYRARLSPGDVFIIPSSHPVAINASSNLCLLGFGINAENNQRNFLAGEDDNVISQIHRPVKELAFPGSAKEVDRLFDNQKQSHFASAQREGGSQRRSPLSSILGAFY